MVYPFFCSYHSSEVQITGTMKPYGSFFTLSLFLLLLVPSSCETDTLLQGQHLKDGQELVSAFRIFKLGFFSPDNSRKRYLGLWYNSFYLHGNSKYGDLRDRAVWVANRNDPVLDRSSSLTIDSVGKLKILRGAKKPLELSSTETTINTTLKLLDSGNLLLQEMGSDGSAKRIIWQSFDHPTDTLLPGMRVGFNSKTGKRWELTSWLGDNLPASGSFNLGMDPSITNRMIILWRGHIYWATGLWFKGIFTLHQTKDTYLQHHYFNFSYVSTESEKYFEYSFDGNDNAFPRITIDQQGSLRIISLHGEERQAYAHCFPVNGLVPQIGCSKQKFPDCQPFYDYFSEETGSISSSGFILNETSGRLSSYDCYIKCVQNCSCLAYASTNEDGTGCEIWSSKPSLDQSSSIHPRNIFVRASLPGPEKEEVWLVVTASVILTVAAFCLFFLLVLKKFKMKVTVVICHMFNFLWREVIPRVILFFFVTIHSVWRRLQILRANAMTDQEMLLRELGVDRRRMRRRTTKKDNELQFLSFQSVASATDNFSDANKLGEGGFGAVYKGKLQDGQEVAIKRLSRGSGQGLEEFKNEATLIAKLQHTNLVQLVGCCIEKEEKVLIYEYLPNKSLDFFLFDPVRRNILDWKTRINIIEGIIQGLLYLHKYSRLRVIHRDIKASNILLDEEMNPKISDFGMARIFRAHESRANTGRLAGTLGYMSPEYVREGLFSTKSDVYSFGVLLLEIVSGRKNNSFDASEGPLNLIIHAWDLWSQNRVWELIDPTLEESSMEDPEVLRCIQVALLCVQGNAADRPSMLDVLSMIYSEVGALPSPKHPAFYNGFGLELPVLGLSSMSTIRATVTDIEAP